MGDFPTTKHILHVEGIVFFIQVHDCFRIQTDRNVKFILSDPQLVPAPFDLRSHPSHKKIKSKSNVRNSISHQAKNLSHKSPLSKKEFSKHPLPNSFLTLEKNSLLCKCLKRFLYNALITKPSFLFAFYAGNKMKITFGNRAIYVAVAGGSAFVAFAYHLVFF